MRVYLDLLEEILTKGVEKPDRTGVGTIGLSSARIQHDLSKGFPLLTTKKIAARSMAVELEFFIKGFTDKRWLQERGCKIWNDWANPQSADPHDLGPVYGFQWRHFDAHYPGPIGIDRDGSDIGGEDQLANVIKTLKTKPNDRRLIVTAWNPNQLGMMALPACHMFYQFIVQGDRLDLNWYQRSVDTMLGLPFNLASYALLLHLVAKEVGLKEGVVTGDLGDTHIYRNHIAAAREQLARSPDTYPLPGVVTEPFNGVLNWDHTQTRFTNYHHHPPIKMEVAV